VDSTDLAFAGIAKQADLVRASEVSSRELVQLYLDRIERIDPELNSFRTVYRERALAEADQADARHGAGDERPLLGVPVAVKDCMDVAGDLTAHGSAAHDGQPAREDCELVKRLRTAGAVVLGKTNAPELMMLGCTESAAWGITRNPWDTDRTPAGSSGGSGAAVAAGLAGCATASDGAGSIRLPAANCGLFGLKPARGRVSLLPDTEHWHHMSVFGCLSRSVADTALFLDCVSGAAPGDADVAPVPERSFSEAAATPPGKLRIALSLRPATPAPLDSEVRQATLDTADLLRSLGHEVSEFEPAYNEIGAVFLPRYLNGCAVEAGKMARPERLMRRTRGFVRMGRPLGGAIDWTLRDEARQAERINRWTQDHDVLMTPMTAQPPVEVGRWEGMGALRTLLGMILVYPYGATWNALGQPAASVPAGFNADGLPLAVQLVGRPSDESTLLSLAAQLEAERRWTEQRPALAA
jgi:amidase